MINYTAKEYDIYLESDEWENIRDRVLEERGRQCEICGTKERLQVHHCDYSANPNYAVLCKECHSVISQMVMDYNDADWKNKLDLGWIQNFVSEYMLGIYKRIYCPQKRKYYNFLNHKRLLVISDICKNTLAGQCKRNAGYADINDILQKRIATATGFYSSIRDKVAQYRKEFTEREIQEGVPLYAINHWLGLDVKYLNRGGS